MSQALTAVRLAYRRSRTLVALTIIAVVAIPVVVLDHRSPSRSVAASERQLRKGYLEPLTKAGLAVSASPDTVAQVLDQKTAAVIVDDRAPIGIQQYRGEPNRGWNGGIEAADGGSIVSLVKNNIATSERSVPIGWQPICPETRPS